LIAVQFRQILWAFLSASPQGIHGGEHAAEAISAHGPLVSTFEAR